MYEFFFFFSFHLFYHVLTFSCLTFTFIRLTVDEPHWESSSGIFRSFPCIMRLDPLFEIIRVSSIVGSIMAFENVYHMCHIIYVVL